MSLKIALPSTEALLRKASGILNPVFEKTTEIQEENKILEGLRDWFLPMLMNGEITVNQSTKEDQG